MCDQSRLPVLWTSTAILDCSKSSSGNSVGVRLSDVRQTQRGLSIGAVVVLLLIGASLLVTLLEQLRDRRRLLAILVAFGTRRSTIAWSILWQAAVPILLGLALAVIAGITLGAVLLQMVGESSRPIVEPDRPT